LKSVPTGGIKGEDAALLAFVAPWSAVF